MPKFAVPAEVRSQRYHTCLSCKHFRKSTRSCGDLLIGNQLSEEDLADYEKQLLITHKKKKVKLCGCFMGVKTWLIFAECPIGKWGSHGISAYEKEELRIFLDKIGNKNRLSEQEIDEIYRWNGMLSGKKLNRCNECLKQILSDMREELNRA